MINSHASGIRGFTSRHRRVAFQFWPDLRRRRIRRAILQAGFAEAIEDVLDELGFPPLFAPERRFVQRQSVRDIVEDTFAVIKGNGALES